MVQELSVRTLVIVIEISRVDWITPGEAVVNLCRLGLRFLKSSGPFDTSHEGITIVREQFIENIPLANVFLATQIVVETVTRELALSTR